MPGILKVKVIEGRNLPVMDKSGDTTDAYVEIKLGSILYKTDVCRKTLNPQWNSEWYRFEMDDTELQDEPLQLRLMDHDTYSANDMIGKIYFNLNPLLQSHSRPEFKYTSSNKFYHPSTDPARITGWFPVFDTIHGLRGELHVTIRLQLFSDFNKFRQSSCGIHFFASSIIPYDADIQAIYGLVEELVVEEDPEYQWIEKIRTPRASNEARQSTFYKISGELQRKIGLKVLELGGNAIIGYRQRYDLEGETGGVIVRGIGTAVKMTREESILIPKLTITPCFDLNNKTDDLLKPINNIDKEDCISICSSVASKSSISSIKRLKYALFKKFESRSSTPPISEMSPYLIPVLYFPNIRNNNNNNNNNKTITIKDVSNSANNVTIECSSLLPHTTYTNNNRILQQIQDTTTASNTKWHNPEKDKDSEKITNTKNGNILHKDKLELMEYPFLTFSMFPQGFILHLGGTVSARSVKLLGSIEEPESRDSWWTELRVEIKSHMKALACNVVLNYKENTSICDEVCVLSASGTAAIVRTIDGNVDVTEGASGGTLKEEDLKTCALYHVPYRKSSLPFNCKFNTCAICECNYVPDMLFVTIEPLKRMPVLGTGSFIHAFVYRLKRDCKSELNAREISDGLPFLEYELNKQLVNKLRIRGMNSIFGLDVQVSIGEKMICAYATGTAVLLSPLPRPPEPSVICSTSNKFVQLQNTLIEAVKKNKLHYQLPEKETMTQSIIPNPEIIEDTSAADAEFVVGYKQTYLIEIDEEDDTDIIISQLIDGLPPQGLIVSATERIAGNMNYCPLSNVHMLAQVWRLRFPSQTPITGFNKLLQRMIHGLYIKIHERIPCSLNKVTFKLDIQDTDELQVCVIGMALGIRDPEVTATSDTDGSSDGGEGHLISSDDDASSDIPNQSLKKSLRKPCHPWDTVEVTTLSYIPAGTIRSYLGYMDFVFIRESTGVREQTGGVNNFVDNFLTEVTSIVKSHVMGIGGNGIVSFFLNECVLTTHSHKNQGQCLIHVGGDAVYYACK